MMIEIETGERKIEAVLADSVLEHFLGMRFRKKEKMFFDFGREKNPLIDMLFVRKPLYLYFIDEGKTVVDLQEAEPWGINPMSWKFYRASSGYRFLLESFESLPIEKGDEVEFDL